MSVKSGRISIKRELDSQAGSCQGLVRRLTTLIPNLQRFWRTAAQAAEEQQSQSEGGSESSLQTMPGDATEHLQQFEATVRMTAKKIHAESTLNLTQTVKHVSLHSPQLLC